MEAIAALALGAVVFMHAWQLFGLSAPKTTGIVGATGAIALTLLAGWAPVPTSSKVALHALLSTIVIWAIYAALVAAVGLWNVDPRGLGLYSAYGAVVMIGQVIYCFTTAFTLAGLICGIVQAVAFAMLFFYLAIPLNGLKKATAWVLVLVGPIHGILAALMLMGIPGIV
jgi:hypothetical protein